MPNEAEQIKKAINWLESPEGKLEVAKQLLIQCEEIEDWVSWAIINHKREELEKEILEQSK